MPNSGPTTVVAVAAAWTTILTRPQGRLLKLIGLWVNNRSGVNVDLQTRNQSAADFDGNAVADAAGRYQLTAGQTTHIIVDPSRIEVWDNLQINIDAQPCDFTPEYEEWPEEPIPLDE